MRKKERGFSLIELIIAIAILIILTGLLAPQFMKYIEKSRKAACLHAMDTIAEEYLAGLTDLGRAPDSAAAVQVLNKIIVNHGGNDKGTEISSIVYAYDGLCKSGGKYRCQLVNNLEAVRIECSKHGEWEMDIVTLHSLLTNMDLSSYKGVAYKNLAEFFKKNTTLDSEAISTDTAGYGEYGSFAKVVAEELSKQGLNVKNKSWMMCKSGDSYILYLTDSKITLDDAKSGAAVTCKKYDTKNGTVTSGTVTVNSKTIVSGKPYPIVKDGSFAPESN
ncbi:prepilin-type N-terminal cleavage/methylation domain-containing protein [uncultured Clostridium sp.]|uniref:prepilin-type N-terminal cleavage/methylation domain-containing protein n=1 Tax=uncultured Clostridium sp. TaxID=59620 RepID=UPI0025D52B42|nr:prepilin-type N-terminal cleavage/methylation domain-containing protein [uncultured Clostridium sp.]